MTDPVRLHEDDTNSLGALLLKAGRDYAPADARLRRVAAGIAGAGAAIAGQPVAAAASAAAGSALGVKASGTALVTVLKWLGVGALGGLTLSVTATVIEDNLHSSRESQPPRVPIEAVQQLPARAQLRTEPRPAVLPETTRPAQQQRTSERSAVRSPARRSVVPTPEENPVATADTEQRREGVPAEPDSRTEANRESPSKAAGEALREEVAALGLAKAALDRGSAQEALAHVSAYRVRFPRGRLGPEATYLEMEAEVLRGNAQRARRLAAQLTSVASPNAKRVREVLQGGAR